MTRILFATKFSSTCQNALGYLKSLVSENQVKIDLIHIFDLPILASQSLPIYAIDDSIEVQDKEISRELLKIADDIPLQNRGQVKAVYGSSPASEIANYAKNGSYMLVAMGMQRRAGITHRLLGSTTLHTINHSEIAVLAVPDGAKFDRIHKIIFPTTMVSTSLLSQEEEGVLHWLSDFSSVFRFPHIHMIHIDQKKATDQAKITFKNKPIYGVEFSKTQAATVEEGVLEFCRKERAEILALYKPHRPYWERLFHSSITRKLLAKASLPLLIFHGK